MPANKYALLRYRIIDRCINNSRNPFPSKEKLRGACEEALYGSDGEHISVSTIEKDIWAMRNESELGYYAPISYHRDQRGYFYEEEGYSINEVQLNDDDLDAIRFAANTLIQFRDLPIFKQFDEAIGKIADRLSVAPDLDTTGVDRFMQFESTPSAKGSKHLAPLLAAARNHYPIKLGYRKFSSESDKSYLVHPYLLKEYRNRWYLLAWDPERKFIRTFGCDRITNITPLENSTFTTLPSFDSDSYFKHAVGITVIDDSNPVDVVFVCDPILARYLESKPLHPSQTITHLDSTTQITLHVLITYELVQWILGFSADIKIISPPSLRSKLQERLSAAQELYEKT
ncbi:MAG TPA: WYL domain-containing protein [Flavobacteriales bacterium]|jgi:predicted DNA-binding transcriptional regulator YafY|nr:WYL domain-containing protein [Flavobacteriales bacterium]HIO16583.1 WYL domain-containing protein [Flavobacteriales bacterium]HIO58683.1 WYL domain-containing protein [Flavobacteriales bacterium]